MRIAMLGDVMGRAGRTALSEQLPGLRKKLKLDFVVVNAENAAGGFGVTARVADELLTAGADVLTTGNHAFDQRDELSLFDDEPRLLRPANFPSDNPGRGATLLTAANGEEVLVLNAQGQRFMEPIDDPRLAIERELNGIELGREAQAILVDFHAETTSEKYSVGHYLDGRVSLVVGTHTHVPTADHQILNRGTGFCADIGMCGDYDSVIGMEKSEPLHRFTTKMTSSRMTPASGEATISGVFIITDPQTGLVERIEPIRTGGRLAPHLPVVD